MTTTTQSEGYLTGSPWNARRTIAVFLFWLLGGLLGGIVSTAFGLDPLSEAAGLATAIAFQSAAALLAVTLYSQSAGNGSLAADAGLVVRARHWYGILLGFVVQLAIGLLLIPVAEIFNIDSDAQAVSELASETLDSTGRILLFISFVLAAPVVEEVLFRGVLLGWLAKRVNRHAAVLISAAAFGLAHWESPDVLLPVIGLGLLAIPLAYAALRVGNLSLSIMMHAGINLLAFFVLVFEDTLTEIVEDAEVGISMLIRWFM